MWSLSWASKRTGTLFPPVVGRFALDGTGTFHGDDEHDGHKVKVRLIWSGITVTTGVLRGRGRPVSPTGIGTSRVAHPDPAERPPGSMDLLGSTWPGLTRLSLIRKVLRVVVEPERFSGSRSRRYCGNQNS
ncbi:hypothetical protein ACFVRD_49000, partial [Streptomyces sp. NPDC057908]